MPAPAKPVPALTDGDVKRFKAKFVEEIGCWRWTARIDRAGYGTFRAGGRSLIAHRVAYVVFVGPIPDGQHVLHTCDNRMCVNPAHLFIGSNRDNILDRNAKGRANMPAGEECSWAKLTDADIVAIRKRYVRVSKIVSNARRLATEYGVSKSHILQIIRGTTRKLKEKTNEKVKKEDYDRAVVERHREAEAYNRKRVLETEYSDDPLGYDPSLVTGRCRCKDCRAARSGGCAEGAGDDKAG